MASRIRPRTVLLSGNVSVPKPGLNRVLGLKELVLYGIVLIQPTAPMPLYGVVCQQAKGHVVTTILIGMVAMLFTAISYGRMACQINQQSSAYPAYPAEARAISLGSRQYPWMSTIAIAVSATRSPNCQNRNCNNGEIRRFDGTERAREDMVLSF